jgi:hypothetical protein
VCEHNLIGSDLQHPEIEFKFEIFHLFVGEILSVKLLGNKKIYLRNYIILIDVSIDIDFSIKVNLDCVSCNDYLILMVK